MENYVDRLTKHLAIRTARPTMNPFRTFLLPPNRGDASPVVQGALFQRKRTFYNLRDRSRVPDVPEEQPRDEETGTRFNAQDSRGTNRGYELRQPRYKVGKGDLCRFCLFYAPENDPSLALRLGAGFVPIRKKGKLPRSVETASYKKESGENFFQIQSDSITEDQTVLIADDIIAPGKLSLCTLYSTP